MADKLMIFKKFIISRKFYKNYLFGIWVFIRKKAVIKKWIKAGKSIPPPDIYKQSIILEYSKKFRLKVLIETGTYYGGTIKALKNYFKKIYSIELNDSLYMSAKSEFQNNINVFLLKGDSSEILPELLKELKEPCIFWLDAHYSGGPTSRGNKYTPILEELKAISVNSIFKNVLLIDDARLFNGTGDYPTLGDLRYFTNKYFYGSTLEIKDDIIQIYYK